MTLQSRSSMCTRFLKQLIPIALVGVIVGGFTWISLRDGTGNLDRFKEIGDLSLATRIHVSEMGSAMKGYMLNPDDQTEYERKKAADDANAEALARLDKMVEEPRIKQLIDSMSKLDEVELNPAEDKTMDLVKARSFEEARRVFTNEYLPLREKYNALSEKLADEINQYVRAETRAVNDDLRRVAIHIMLLLGAGLLGTAILFYWSVNKLSAEFRLVTTGLGGISERLTASSQELNSASHKLSDTSAESASALEETTTSIRELNEAFRQNAERSASAAAVAGTSRGSATQGRESVRRMADAIGQIESGNKEINSAIAETNSRMSEITQVIGEISQKTQVINDIVFQTKLLSFNASVEAARAGEHGKGFAVVAEEIGNLANMSGHAAQEIGQLLEESIGKVETIVQDSKRSVEGLMDSNHHRVSLGSQVAEECAGALEQIVSYAEESEKLAFEISESTKMQLSRIDAVTIALEQIGKSVHDAADSSHATSEASSQLRAESSGLRENVERLSALVDGCESGVDAPVENLKPDRGAPLGRGGGMRAA